MHLRDHRFGRPPDGHEFLRRSGLPRGDHGEILARIPSAVGHHGIAPMLEAAAEVVTAGEGAAGTAQHDDLDVLVALGQPDSGLDLVGHGRDDGVELFRAVERDGGHRPGRRVQQRLEIGCRHSSSEVTSALRVKCLSGDRDNAAGSKLRPTRAQGFASWHLHASGIGVRLRSLLRR